MKNSKSILLNLFFLILFGCSQIVERDPRGIQENTSSAKSSPYVVMISLDGFRHDYLKKYDAPFMSKIVKTGIQAERLIPIFPSKTFPNHYSLVTGLYAENHGLVANRFYDPELKESYQLGNSKNTRQGKWYGGSPLWLSVREQGMLSASFFWVGSDANINGNYPNYYIPYDGKISNDVRVETILEWLQLPEEKRPHFLTLYFSDVDSAGHRYGPDSLEVAKAIREVDQQISKLVEKTKALNLSINFVIVSDHGMKAIENAKKVYLSEFIDPSKAQFKERGPLTLIYMNNPRDLKGYKNALKKVPFTKVYERKDLPKRFHFSKTSRAGDLILLAEPGAYIYPEKEKKDEQSSTEKYSGGTHGYDPGLSKEMSGIFLAFGPNVTNDGLIKPFENIHVYPYVMGLLGLPVKQKIDGDQSVLKSFLK
ncbi:MAG: ectonucleotide pyrophosphatase/phosphodiesterase [Bacteriovoracaceae bacterium]|nr:ectonucleotide pyrophosphatase/phosphodiesterase [Bacteriovoracaceae bacterium]